MRLKLFIAIIISTSICYQTVSAQQIFKISQFVQHNYINNPAATGANTQASVGAAYRKMWAGMPGGPQTTILYGDKYFDSKNTGVGAVLYSDITGPTSRTGGQVNLSYSIEMKEGKRLMFGLSGMFMQYRIDRASFARYIPNDPLLAGDGSEMKGDAAAGVGGDVEAQRVAGVPEAEGGRLQRGRTGRGPPGLFLRGGRRNGLGHVPAAEPCLAQGALQHRTRSLLEAQLRCGSHHSFRGAVLSPGGAHYRLHRH